MEFLDCENPPEVVAAKLLEAVICPPTGNVGNAPEGSFVNAAWKGDIVCCLEASCWPEPKLNVENVEPEFNCGLLNTAEFPFGWTGAV